MASNLERFKDDLARLIREGQALDIAMVRDISKSDEFLKQVREQLGKEKADAFLKTLPVFETAYEAWYSECLASPHFSR
jgi:hypothetical protein